MLSPFEMLDMRRDAHIAMTSYREVVMVMPAVTSGSNYEAFTDSPYDITGAAEGSQTVSFTTYRVFARIKIIQDTSLALMNNPVPALEVGDYLLYFKDSDKALLDKMVQNKNAYLFVDGNRLHIWNTSPNGVGQAFDIYAHCKKYDPRFKAQGL